jgi:hypothetical protein
MHRLYNFFELRPQTLENAQTVENARNEKEMHRLYFYRELRPQTVMKMPKI